MTQNTRTKREFTRRAWGLIYPYWLSSEKWIAWTLLIVIVGLNLGLVYLTVLLNGWYGEFYNSLQQKNFEDFKRLLLTFGGLAFLYILGAVYRLYLQQMLEIKWRKWLTDSYLSEWLAQRRYYLLQLKEFGTDNPDQRIAEDVQILARSTLTLSLGLLSSITTLVSFFMILWNLSGPISFQFLGSEITIQGYMVWIAFVYALIGSVLTHWIGKALIRLNFNQQRYEADFRYSLVRVRENSEAIALLRGEENERRGLGRKFSEIITNWWSIMRYQKRLTWFTAAYGQLASVFPLIVGAPRYFGGLIELGALMQISSAFGRVQDALSWFIDSYASLTQWKASVDRLLGFQDAWGHSDELLSGASRELQRTINSSQIKGMVSLSLPDQTPLKEGISLAIQPKDRVQVHGTSGKGKSTLFRALSGLWPFAKGTLEFPEERAVFFLPQKPYLPIASLRDVLSYPDLRCAVSDEHLIAHLKALNLEKFVGELDTICDWSKRMSLGEQQRVAVIRAILKDPSWLFLDEATASLDTRSQELVQEFLAARLPNAAIISIDHRVNSAATKEVIF